MQTIEGKSLLAPSYENCDAIDIVGHVSFEVQTKGLPIVG